MKQVTPSTTLSRKVGIEVEIDDPKASDFPVVDGWAATHDGSIRGREYVLEKPTKVNAVKDQIVELSKALQLQGMRPHMRGSIHIHVQAADISDEACLALNEAYYELQPLLRKLIASYRFGPHGKKYAPAVSHESAGALAIHFNFKRKTAGGRAEAKRARKYAAVNFAMMGCSDAKERSIEFRQFSTSTRTDVIYGYAILAAALVEAAVAGRAGTQADLLEAVQSYFPEFKAWQAWRTEHLAGGEDAAKAIRAALTPTAMGVYAAAKVGNCSVGAARKILGALVNDGHAILIRKGSYCGVVDAQTELVSVRLAQSSWLTA